MRYKQTIFIISIIISFLSNSNSNYAQSATESELNENLISNKEKKIEDLQRELALLNSKYKQKKTEVRICIGAVSACAGAVILLLFLNYHRKKKHELHLKNEELAYKDKELLSILTEKSEKEAQIIQVIRELEDSNTNNPQLDQLKLRLKDNPNSWKAFKTYFENIHPQFLDSLNEQSTELSVNERRMCAYIKLELTNKEIAKILNIYPSSVVKSKNRIKKKLGLNGEENLNVYLMSI